MFVRFLYLVAYLSSYHEKAMKALLRASSQHRSYQPPVYHYKIKESRCAMCIFQRHSNELAGLFSTLSLQCRASSKEDVNANFKVNGLTHLGIKPESTVLKTNALSIRPSELFKFEKTVLSCI